MDRVVAWLLLYMLTLQNKFKMVRSDAKRSRSTPNWMKSEKELKDDLKSFDMPFKEWVSFSFVFF